MTKETLDSVSWIGLNLLLSNATEETCRDMLMLEEAGKRRAQYLKRIHARLNKMRARRERNELGK